MMAQNLTSMTTDEIFREEKPQAADFRFNKAVAQVFDNMVNRSVPFYGEIQRMIAELAADHARPGTRIYDLGCSTGTTMIGMDSLVDPGIEFVGVDDSDEMLEKCRTKLTDAGISRSVQLVPGDLNENVKIQDASVVVLCLTLQFVRPLYREKLLKKIFNGLCQGGVLILVEKILAEDSSFNRDFIKYYYNLKRRSQYNEMEIAQKREALENVLIPYKLS
jgi:tRNA (cmo5U34)-methyltransferase